jgi:hypothetical protein
VAVYLRCDLWDLLISNSLAIAAVTTARHSLANGISDAKAERTTDRKRNHTSSMGHRHALGVLMRFATSQAKKQH